MTSLLIALFVVLSLLLDCAWTQHVRRQRGASVVTTPIAPPATVTRDKTTSATSAASSSSPFDDTFVGTLDGQVHAVDTRNGASLWSFATGDALFASSVSLDDNGGSSTPIFIPGLDGTVFAHSASDKKLRRLPLTIKDLVARSPFQTGDGTLLAGRKTTRVFVVDRRTGALLRSFSSDNAFDGNATNDNGEPLTDDAIVIGRSDYHISALDATTGSLAWNMSRLVC